MNRVLEGMLVLELTAIVQGPSVGAMLADLGAEVIKVENMDGGDPLRHSASMRGVPVMGPDGVSLAFTWQNRNKKSIAINLMAPGASDVMFRILRKSDVFITNFRPMAVAKLGLSYERVAEINPRIIYAELTGFGSRGPYKDVRAMASSGLAVAGILTAERDHRQGPVPGSLVQGDQMGAIAGTYGILAALLAYQRFGIGQKVSASIVGGALWIHQMNLAMTCLTGKEFSAAKRTRPVNALSGVYRTSDGKWIAISMSVHTEESWFMLCEALGRPRLAQDPRFATRQGREANSRPLSLILQRAFRQKTRGEWVQLGMRYDLTIAPVNSLEEAVDDTQLVENGYVTSFQHPVLGEIKFPGMPFDLSATPGSVCGPAPKLDEHAEYVLKQIAGYSPSEIERLKASHVVA